MRTIIMHILLVVALASTAHAETKCYAVEHQDHDEAVCVGDENFFVNKSAPTKSISSVSVVQQFSPPVSVKASAIGTATGTLDNKTVKEMTTQQSGDIGSYAASHLARRKAMAINNSLKLNGKASQPEPGTEQVPK